MANKFKLGRKTPKASDADEKYKLPGDATWGREAETQRRQEYNRKMGETADFLRGVITGDQITDPADVAQFESDLAKDEETYVNRQRARSVSLGLARDILFLRTFESLARRVLSSTIKPVGYATTAHDGPASRTLNLMLSDLHLGARLVPDENPEAYGVVEESRRLAFTIAQAADWKPRYRDSTHLNLLLNGDLIQGMLQHDDVRDGAVLTEQATEAVYLFKYVIGYLAAAFPRVDVWCQTGNHGRNRLRHEGRATTSKWDSYETILYVAARAASESLENVVWHIPKAPVCLIPVHDRWMLMTHGDTELQLADPGKHSDYYARALDQINAGSPPRYGEHVDLLAVGHWHTPTIMHLGAGAAIINGAMIPPAGYARSAGYASQCGQYMWESSPGYAIGDSRLVYLGASQDNDKSLDKIIPPFKLDLD